MLHVLAQGGYIRHRRTDDHRIIDVLCFTRDGHVLADCTLDVFAKLRRKRLIESRASSPYRISDEGRRSVRAQLDNR
ncbi:hypothetical protein A33M_0218 [Rhodovulum sp. PH10]|nr:hypothetical protein A33M_0218 [Rhodovulum sp. PH10]